MNASLKIALLENVYILKGTTTLEMLCACFSYCVFDL